MGKRNEHRRQKALAKHKAKRKKAREAHQSFSSSLRERFSLASQAPILDCKVPKRLFEMGIGNIVFSRQLPSGMIAVAVFLVDVYCLGVKNAVYDVVDPGKYEQMMERFAHSEPLESVDPAYARKLVEGAVAYAQRFSLTPHPDYKVAQKIFGNVDGASCPDSFEYGQQGKPFYVAGPNDTPAKSREVVSSLEKSCGPDGFHYMVGV